MAAPPDVAPGTRRVAIPSQAVSMIVNQTMTEVKQLILSEDFEHSGCVSQEARRILIDALDTAAPNAAHHRLPCAHEHCKKKRAEHPLDEHGFRYCGALEDGTVVFVNGERAAYTPEKQRIIVPG